MSNYDRYDKKSGPSRLFHKLGLPSLVSFFSTRVVRGGPRILFHLAATLVVVFLFVRLARRGLYSPTSFFNWNPDQVVQAVGAEIQLGEGNRPITSPEATIVLEDDRLIESNAAGGLRIVVFGEDDVASPSRLRTYRGTRRPSWTEQLCHELRCSSYLSFTQDFDVSSYPVVSQDLHNAAIKLLLENSAKEVAGGGKPGKDYSFHPEKFPIDRSRPDLARQVRSFLAMERPQTPPSDTLWVFTLGAWDIWSLASMPTSISKPLVGLLTSHIFEQIDVLYRNSLYKESVAFSDLSANVTGEDGKTGIGRNFQILIPTLFDPSLTPGWARSRPELPEVHSKAEQLRNSVHLTDEWNDQILTNLEEWINQPYPRASDLAKSKRGKGKETTSMETISPPQRDAFAYDMAGSLLDTIMDEQLRVADLRTQVALGKNSNENTEDVLKPCVDDASSASVSETERNRDESDQADRRRPQGNGRDRNRKAYKNQRHPNAAAVICRAPDEHLFYSEFELGTRTISAIARQVAGMVVRNESVRAAWAADDEDKGT
ncbi:hypothetical protein V8F20_001464 [Naviculisporaceae sp. PSN 640]